MPALFAGGSCLANKYYCIRVKAHFHTAPALLPTSETTALKVYISSSSTSSSLKIPLSDNHRPSTYLHTCLSGLRHADNRLSASLKPRYSCIEKSSLLAER